MKPGPAKVAYATRYYRDNRDHLRAQVKARASVKRMFLSSYKLTVGCLDCGYREHACALDFDHLPEFGKRFEICGRGLVVSWESLLAEMEKCEVVCSNCHRVRTRDRRAA